MLNRVILVGRLVRDPELKYTPSGTAVCNFTLAVPRKFNKDETDFIDCQVWRGLAETCASHLTKGSLVAVEGRLQVRSYEDRDQKKKKVTEVVVDDCRFLDKKGKGGSSSGSGSRSTDDDWNALGREIDTENINFGGDDDLPY